MPKVLIVYITRTGETARIGELIAEGLRMAGADVTLAKAENIKKEIDLKGFDAYVFGSATYHGEMMQSMKTLLFLAEKVDLEGKVGGSFGAFGWSGEAPERIFDTMKHVLKMDMTGGALMLKKVGIGGALNMAHEYGREIAKKIM
ncbi:MAG: FprA family A-type flavoprotein [Desulfobacterales bacterium]|jgi:flavorubredoxin|nr:FprA family A-type flavoprotein [Desulfobacteraceae bacterium]MBT7085510.1 FprA family A-type flavoprotein [Desulfobacterales bacterium]MBT7695997.1 FprA family A-type flavoprotein [Desulfobacterales bacterium]